MRAAFLAFLLICAGLALDPSRASACPSSSTSEIRLLGVDPEGNAVRYSERWGENADETWRTFLVNDADGARVASMTLEAGQIKTDDPNGYFKDFLHLSANDAHLIEATIVKAKKLSAPAPKRKVRHVKSDTTCGSIEIESKSGWLRVAEVGVLSYQFEGSCPALNLEALEHAASNVVFVRVKYQLGQIPKGDSYTTYELSDEVLLLPTARVKAAELALLGERARTRRKLDEAIPMLEKALALAPNVMSTRSSLIRAYARAGRDWQTTQAMLDAPIPEDVSLIGAAPSEALLESLPSTWQEAADREEPWPWQARQEPSLRRSFL